MEESLISFHIHPHNAYFIVKTECIRILSQFKSIPLLPSVTSLIPATIAIYIPQFPSKYYFYALNIIIINSISNIARHTHTHTRTANSQRRRATFNLSRIVSDQVKSQALKYLVRASLTVYALCAKGICASRVSPHQIVV